MDTHERTKGKPVRNTGICRNWLLAYATLKARSCRPGSKTGCMFDAFPHAVHPGLATDGGMPMGDCPGDPGECKDCYDTYSVLWNLCNGDLACQTQVYASYLACLSLTGNN